MLFGKPLSTQISNLKSEILVSNNLEFEFKRLTKSANDFFKKKYAASYKFTYEDLKFEILEKNLPESKMIAKLCDSLNELEFDKAKITREKLTEICDLLKNLSDGNFTFILEPLNDEMFAPKELQTKNLNDLPTFTFDLQYEVSSVMESLNKNKSELENELNLIEQEQVILRKEKMLPKFKAVKKVDLELEILASKKNELEQKEKSIEEKIIQLKSIEYDISEHAKRLKDDDLALKEKEDFIISKEKLIDEIRKDFKVKYDDTLKEIESMKQELKEKESNFMELQKFYQKREDRLSTEENNLLEEKRRYGKTVSTLIASHIEIAKDDLEKVELEIKATKKKLSDLQDNSKKKNLNVKKLISEKEMVKKTLLGKKKYFSELEKDFSKKDIEFQKLESDLNKRQEKALVLEQKLNDFENHMYSADSERIKSHQELELKELDLRAIEKQISGMQFEMKNHTLRLDTREKYLNKRISSFEELRKEIKNQIGKEKRVISRIEEKLNERGIKVNRRLNAVETEEENYDSVTRKMYKSAELEDLPIEIVQTQTEGIETEETTTEEKLETKRKTINEITVTHLPDTRVGHPNYLDILRLLNMARDFISKSMIDNAKGCYLEILKLFDDLGENDKDELYGMITDVFKTKGDYIKVLNSKIESLLSQFNSAVERGDLVTCGHIYSMLQQKYLALPREDKSKYYDKIMEIYNLAAPEQAY